jgi:hypothetical protein
MSGRLRLFGHASVWISGTVGTSQSLRSLCPATGPSFCPPLWNSAPWTLDLARDEDDTAALLAVARENTRLLQIAAFADAVNDVDSPLIEADRVAVLSLCGMDATELQIYIKMMADVLVGII